MRGLYFLLFLILASGCSTSTEVYELPDTYAPLLTIRERPAALDAVVDGPWITTVGRHVYVEDLDEWLERTPPGSSLFEAKMRHEQIHAVRQRDFGLVLWIANYAYDAKFALEEEKIGWYRELRLLQARGQFIKIEGVAATLAKYKNLSGNLISYEDALSWVRDVLADRWRPQGE